MKLKFCSIRRNVTKYDVKFATGVEVVTTNPPPSPMTTPLSDAECSSLKPVHRLPVERR